MSQPLILYDNALRYGDGNQPVPSFQALFNDNETIDYGTGPITSTRSSVGYYFDPTTKLLTSAAVDELRFERDPVDGVVRALVEGSSTNVFASTHRAASAWALGGGGTGSVTNDITGVDGVANAALTMLDSDTSVASVFYISAIGLTSGVLTHVNSIDVLKGSATNIVRIMAELAGGSGITASAYIDTTTGELSADSASGAYVEDRGDWWRVCIPITDNGSGNTIQRQYVYPAARVNLNDAGMDVTLTGSVGVDWVQGERGASRVSSHIIGSATRAADVVSIPNSEIPALSNGVTIEGATTLPNDGAVHAVFNATGTGATYLRRATSGVLEGQLGAVSFTTTTTPDELPHLYGLKTDGTNHYVLVDGVSVYTFTGSLTQPTGALYIGSNSGSSEHVNNILGGLRIWSSFLTEAELTANSSGYAISTGLEQSGTLLSEAWTWDALRNAILTADVNGAATANLYIRGATPTHFVFGAHRHDAAGFRLNEGMCYIDAYTSSGWTNVGNANLATNASNLPELIILSAYTPVLIAGHYQFRMRLTGLTASSDFAIPELFLGEALTMPYIEYGFDPSVEEWTGPSTTAETGRIYESALSRRYTANPSFTYIDGATATAIDAFRETHLEERTPFWWFWEPTSNPTVGYMMRHHAKSAPMPIVNAIYRKLQLSMIEAV